MQVLPDASAGSLVGVAKFARDARGPPLAVGRMPINFEKVNQSVTKGYAVIALHTWEDYLWPIKSKGEPPEAVPVSAMGDQDVGVGDGGGANGSDVGADALSRSG